VATTPTYTDFSYHHCPTFDFMQELLAQGKDVEVLRPASFRREMMEMLREAMGRYGE
jgi:predicted DNA-binding transcriptional regulator YafY